jgi:hypothetical protein
VSDSVYYSPIVGITGLADSISFTATYSLEASDSHSYNFFNLDATVNLTAGPSTVSTGNEFVSLLADSFSYNAINVSYVTSILGEGVQSVSTPTRFTKLVADDGGSTIVRPKQVWIG